MGEGWGVWERCGGGGGWVRGTYHVHETVFSTLTGNIVCLPFPAVNTNALSQRRAAALLRGSVCDSLSHCPHAPESSWDRACVRATVRLIAVRLQAHDSSEKRLGVIDGFILIMLLVIVCFYFSQDAGVE